MYIGFHKTSFTVISLRPGFDWDTSGVEEFHGALSVFNVPDPSFWHKLRINER